MLSFLSTEEFKAEQYDTQGVIVAATTVVTRSAQNFLNPMRTARAFQWASSK
jgi:hypothetical protein